jgi:hypothetical protein
MLIFCFKTTKACSNVPSLPEKCFYTKRWDHASRLQIQLSYDDLVTGPQSTQRSNKDEQLKLCVVTRTLLS